jgi:hypothetical protein
MGLMKLLNRRGDDVQNPRLSASARHGERRHKRARRASPQAAL